MVLEATKMKNYIKKFVKDRNWDFFQSPKNLSMALNVEASELLEIFQWMSEKQSFDIKNDPEVMENIKDEMSDILFFLMRIADILNIDLNKAFWSKTKKNEKKYTLEKGKALSDKVLSYGKKDINK